MRTQKTIKAQYDTLDEALAQASVTAKMLHNLKPEVRMKLYSLVRGKGEDYIIIGEEVYYIARTYTGMPILKKMGTEFDERKPTTLEIVELNLEPEHKTLNKAGIRVSLNHNALSLHLKYDNIAYMA